MFAEDAAAARRLLSELHSDSGFRGQDLVAREYVELDKIGVDPITGIPIAVEFRVFVCGGQVLGATYYWPVDEGTETPNPDCIDQGFLKSAIAAIEDSGRIRFYTLDVARTASGQWIVIEISDGQRAGLQGLDPEILYGGLKRVLTGS